MDAGLVPVHAGQNGEPVVRLNPVGTVAVLCPSGKVGGAEKSVLELGRILERRPNLVLIVPEEGALAEAARAQGLDIRIVNWPRRLKELSEVSGKRIAFSALIAIPAIRTAVRRIAQEISRINPDVILTNGIKAHVLGAFVGRKTGIPYIWHMRDSIEDRPMSRRVLAALAGRCAGIIAISNYVASGFDAGRLQGVKRRVIYNPVDTRRFSPDSSIVEGLKKPGELWVGIIGPLTPLKGQDLFLRAAAEIPVDSPPDRVVFVVVGDTIYEKDISAGYRETLETLAGDLGIADRTVFLGWRDDVDKIVGLIDVLVQSNRGPEGLGRAVLEAMAAGKPVIAFDRWGPAEIVQHDVTGFLVPWMDVSGLSSAISTLVADAPRRQKLGRAAKDWIDTNLDSRVLACAFRSSLNDFTRNQAAS